jgi:glycosyltransferase involved in cell wall biosynthesis
MAAAKPVIGTNTRGIADAITPETGWLAEKNDPAALARAIEAAASDPDEVRRRGTAARERAVAEFALPRIIDAYEELYREALTSRV